MEAQHQEAIDESAGVSPASQFGCFDSNVVDSDSLYYDLGEDLNVTNATLQYRNSSSERGG
ncbi:hypothetical protein DPMN_131069 [Dreissena polymorpha]|uniref:Uncharacterized protein n=1 Tax=Dreissena polymorpha TaxID=45954 RepID=A0A9D4H3Y6_DREPO|nr:hypothetical protein DPMN_131069 [Dreissena polymorpha]